MRRFCNVDQHIILLLHFDGDIVDSASNTAIVNSGITFSEGVFGQCAHKTGNAFLTLPEGYLADLVAKEEFTIDLWYKSNVFTDASDLFIGNCRSGDTGSMRFMVYMAGSYFRIYVGNLGNENYFTLLWADIDPALKGQWMHIAWCVKGSMQYIFINGHLVASGQIANKNVPAYTTMMFNVTDLNANHEFLMDEFRISDICRWTSDFEVPKTPYA